MKKKILLIITSLLIVVSANCTNITGYVQGYNSYYRYYYPFVRVFIELQYWNGNQWVTGTYTYSGADGYYYFYNVLPGYYYNLRINGGNNFQIYVSEPRFQYLPVITI